MTIVLTHQLLIITHHHQETHQEHASTHPMASNSRCLRWLFQVCPILGALLAFIGALVGISFGLICAGPFLLLMEIDRRITVQSIISTEAYKAGMNYDHAMEFLGFGGPQSRHACQESVRQKARRLISI